MRNYETSVNCAVRVNRRIHNRRGKSLTAPSTVNMYNLISAGNVSLRTERSLMNVLQTPSVPQFKTHWQSLTYAYERRESPLHYLRVESVWRRKSHDTLQTHEGVCVCVCVCVCDERDYQGKETLRLAWQVIESKSLDREARRSKKRGSVGGNDDTLWESILQRIKRNRDCCNLTYCNTQVSGCLTKFLFRGLPAEFDWNISLYLPYSWYMYIYSEILFLIEK